jgi:hypothetical protein
MATTPRPGGQQPRRRPAGAPRPGKQPDGGAPAPRPYPARAHHALPRRWRSGTNTKSGTAAGSAAHLAPPRRWRSFHDQIPHGCRIGGAPRAASTMALRRQNPARLQDRRRITRGLDDGAPAPRSNGQDRRRITRCLARALRRQDQILHGGRYRRRTTRCLDDGAPAPRSNPARRQDRLRITRCLDDGAPATVKSCMTAAFSHAASHVGAQILHRAGVA